MHSVRFAACVVMVTVAVPTATLAQQRETCTEARCSLRLEAGSHFTRVLTPFDPAVVIQGTPEVTRYRLDPSDYFRDRLGSTDSTRAHYGHFVTADNIADAMRSLSNLLLVASMVGWVARGDSSGWPTVSIGVGFGLHLGAEIPAATARREFARAAEAYNSDLQLRNSR